MVSVTTSSEAGFPKTWSPCVFYPKALTRKRSDLPPVPIRASPNFYFDGETGSLGQAEYRSKYPHSKQPLGNFLRIFLNFLKHLPYPAETFRGHNEFSLDDAVHRHKPPECLPAGNQSKKQFL